MELNSNNSPEIAENAGDNSDFRAEIAKSKEMIEEADKPGEKTKKKAGRPTKADKEAEEAAEQAAQAAAFAETTPAESLKPILGFPFDLAAMQTEFEGFRLTDKELNQLAPSAHVVLARYAPQIKGETLSLALFAGSIFSIGLSKYMAFIAFQKQGGRSAQASSIPPQTESPPAEETTATASSFPVQLV